MTGNKYQNSIYAKMLYLGEIIDVQYYLLINIVKCVL
jgi:hypothetical protein